MYVQRLTVAITTAADGSATVYSDNVTGRVLGFLISTGLDNTADLTVTAEATGEPIITITNQNGAGRYYPRVPVHDEAGAGATYDGTNKLREPVAIVNDRVKIVVAQGGNVKSATVTLIIG